MRIIVKKVKPEQCGTVRRKGRKTAAFAAAVVALLAVRYAAGSSALSALPTVSSGMAERTSAVPSVQESQNDTDTSQLSDDEESRNTTATTATTTTLPRSGGMTSAHAQQAETETAATAGQNTVDNLTVDDELDDLLLDEEIDSGISASYNGKLDVPSNVRLDRLDFGSDFVKPLKRARVTSRFDYRVNPVTGRYVFHTGMDLGAASGSDIMAMKAGKVVSAKYNGGYGKVVIVEHENGIRTLYAHCSRLLVKAGDKVSKGQVIALVGSTGNSTGPHLHIEFRKGGKRYDPEWVIGGIYN